MHTHVAFLSGGPGSGHRDRKQPPAAAGVSEDRGRRSRQQSQSTVTDTRMGLATVVQRSRTELRTQSNTKKQH